MFTGAVAAAAPTSAEIVARDISIVMDRSDPSHAGDVGKTHEARIFYDTSKIDPKTQRVPILHQQHTPMLIPFHPDPAVMPVANAWLDLSSKPYRYHMAASPAVEPLPNGKLPWEPYAILFDAETQRMAIRRQSDGALELGGKYTVSDAVLRGPEVDFVINGKGPPPGVTWPPAGFGQAGPVGNGPPAGAIPAGGPPAGMKPPPVTPLKARKGAKLVALGLDIVIDQIAPEDEGLYTMGQHDIARIVYDETAIDPVTKKVPILEESHLIGGRYHPNRETSASSLDLSSKPYRLDYASSVTHGRPLVVLFEGPTERMAILTRPDFRMLIAGKYTIGVTPVPYDPQHPDK